MSDQQAIGERLALEYATVAAVDLLRLRGTECIVLRGSWLARRLYEVEEVRVSLDADLLVADLTASSVVLEEEGYARVIDWTPGMTRHAWTHVKQDTVSIDLHQTLVGIDASPNEVWEVFKRESEEIELAGGRVRVPKLAAQLLIVGLHAAQHGAESTKTTEDLRRALDRYGREAWARAVMLAQELDAEQALAAGLHLLAEGRELAGALALREPATRTVLLRAATAKPTALGIDRLAELGWRDRGSFVVGKAFPPPEFMRAWHPLARRGRAGLVLAYAYRVGWLVRWLPRGFKSVRATGVGGKASPQRNDSDP